MASFDRMRRNLLIAAVCVVAGLTSAGAAPAPAPAASFSASLGDPVSGTNSAARGTTLTFAVDVGPAAPDPEVPGITRLSVQLPPGVRINTQPASGCTADALRSDPAPAACTSAQVGSGVASGFAIGIFFAGVAVTAFRDPDGVSLNLRLRFLQGGVHIIVPVHVTIVPPNAGGGLLEMTIPPIQVSDNEFIDLWTLRLTLGGSIAASTIATTGCDGNWAFGGNAVVRGGASSPYSASQSCTQGPDPVPPPVVLAAPLPQLVPRITVARSASSRRTGRLIAVAGLRSLPDGTLVTARCVRGCSPRMLGSATPESLIPGSGELRPHRAAIITGSSVVEVDAAREGWTGRYSVFGFVARKSGLVARLTENGCLTTSGTHAACAAPAAR